MNKAVKKQWVEALRSGEYEQTEGCLRDFAYDSYAYCCLGVLTDLYAKARKRPFSRCGSSLNAGALPSKQVCDWAGIEYSVTGDERTDVNSLAGMNDNGASFSEIADYIEANL